MNFLGHIEIALDLRDEPRFLLGAILPDLAVMCGGRVAAVDDERVEAGVAHHHLADAAFHGAPCFGELTGATFQRLSSRGVARGPARAAAHVVVELLLDGVLAERQRTADGYLAALSAGAVDRAGGRIRWTDPESSPRSFEGLRTRLEDHGVPRDYARPDVVTQRVVRVLSSRPRLRLDAEGARHLSAIAPDVDDAVRARTDRLLTETRAALASFGG